MLGYRHPYPGSYRAALSLHCLVCSPLLARLMLLCPVCFPYRWLAPAPFCYLFTAAPQDVEYGDGSCPMSSTVNRTFKRYNMVHRLENDWLETSTVLEVPNGGLNLPLLSASIADGFTTDQVWRVRVGVDRCVPVECVLLCTVTVYTLPAPAAGVFASCASVHGFVLGVLPHAARQRLAVLRPHAQIPIL